MTDWICKEVHTDNGGYFEPVAELIRCKECKYYQKIGEGGYCAHRKGLNGKPCADDYCSRAEKEEE